MLNLIKTAVITSWIIFHRIILIKLIFALILIFFANYFYQEWKDLYLAIKPESLFPILVAYNVFILLILFWIFLIVKEFIRTENLEKTLKISQSFEDMPQEYRDIGDVELRPNLKRRHE